MGADPAGGALDRGGRRVLRRVLAPLLLWLAVAGLAALLSGYGIDRGYPTALYGLTAAIVEDHQLSLDGQRDLLGYDKSIYQGRLYSDKAPGPALLMIPPYLLARAATADPDLRFTLTLLLGLTLPAATAPLAVLLLLRRAGSEPLLGAATFAFATLFLPYLTVGTSDAVATAAVAWAFALGFGKDERELWLAGAAAGFAVLARYQTLLLMAPLAIALLVSLRGRAYRFALPLLAGIVAVLGYNLAAFGHPLSFPTYHWQGKAGAAPTLIMEAPSLGRLFDMTLGERRGLLVFTPVLVLAPLGLWELGRRAPRSAAIVVASLGGYFGYLLCNRGWAGGADYGMRFSLVALPLLWLLVFAPDGRIAARARRMLLVPGALVALLGALAGPYVPYREPHPIAYKARDLRDHGSRTILDGVPRGPR